MNNRNEKNNRFESYPKPTETDRQLKDQPEFIDELPDESEDQNVSDTPSPKTDLPKRNVTGEGEE